MGLGWIGLEQMATEGAAVIALIVLVEVLVLVSGLAAVELVAWCVREGQPLWNDHRNHHQKAMDKVVVVCGCGGAVWLAVEVV